MKVYAKTFDSEEQGAVVSARTSRSPSTFDVIHDEVRERGHVAFLEQNVLGYGHDSVAEVAQCPLVCIEDVSDLAANVVALSDPQLVVQMTSTRYQDMGARDVFGEDRITGARMKTRYMAAMPAIQKILDDTDHPRKRTLQCDMARAFLPAGVSTQLAIRGNARVMRDACAYMLGHELPEVQAIGERALAAVKPHIEVLFDRHVVPAPTSVPEDNGSRSVELAGNGLGEARFLSGLYVFAREPEVVGEITAWRDSGWRRRMRIAACPRGPWLTAGICTDYGAYRDLRRNRTLAQDDLLPDSTAVSMDPYWAFRELYPDVCARVDDLRFSHERSERDDPYLAAMGSVMRWHAGGHVLNWAYALRLRSGATCHPAYALPMRALMLQILVAAPWLAEAMGIVESPKSLRGVEFRDRVPA